jgi:DNA-binding NtrC family response regulator
VLNEEQKKIVIIEKDHVKRDFLRSVVAENADLSFCFDRVASCFDNLTQLNPDLIVVGSFPRKGVLRFINAHKATNCNLPSLLMTQDSEIKKYLELNALNNIKMYDIKLNVSTFNNSISNTIRKHRKKAYNNDFPFIVGNSPGIVKIKEILPDLNHSRESILIEGERGTGKEFIVRAIQCLSGSKDLFIKISAKDIHKEVSRLNILEVIGRKIQEKMKGSNTQSPSGVMSTIFIDELGYLPDSIQSELLHVVDNGHDSNNCFSPLVKNNFRFISSTSVGSDYLLSENRLRKDLFYRLNVINLKVEPLRRHKEDIPLLVDYFSYRYCKMLGRSFIELPSETIDIFMDYHWPENTKELESVVKRAIMNGDDGKSLKEMHLINIDTLSKTRQVMIEGLKATRSITDAKDYLKQVERESLKDICSNIMGKVEKKVMRKALEETNWNRKKAAAMLNISYKSMLNKIKQYKLV